MLYITEGILLAKTEIKDREFSYLVLTRDFWKIRGFYREVPKASFYDLGTLLEISIHRKTTTNQFRSLRTVSMIQREGLDFSDLSDFMNLLNFWKIHIPEGAGEGELYEDFRSLIQIPQSPSEFRFACFLFELRALSHYQTWEIGNADPILQKLERLSQNHTLSELLKVRGIPDSLYPIVRLAFLQSFFPWYSSFI